MVNIVGVRTLVPPTVGGPPITEAKMTARAILQCRPNSHPFPVSPDLLFDPQLTFGTGQLNVYACQGEQPDCYYY